MNDEILVKGAPEGFRFEARRTDGTGVDLRYYNAPGDRLYLGWKMSPGVLLEALAVFGGLRTAPEGPGPLPLSIRGRHCLFQMTTREYVYLKELDKLGRPKMTGFEIPSRLLVALLDTDISETLGGADRHTIT